MSINRYHSSLRFLAGLRFSWSPSSYGYMFGLCHKLLLATVSIVFLWILWWGVRISCIDLVCCMKQACCWGFAANCKGYPCCGGPVWSCVLPYIRKLSHLIYFVVITSSSAALRFRATKAMAHLPVVREVLAPPSLDQLVYCAAHHLHSYTRRWTL